MIFCQEKFECENISCITYRNLLHTEHWYFTAFFMIKILMYIQNIFIKLQVVIIWRMERNHLSYNWLSSGWSLDNEMASRKHLEEQVQLLLNTDQSLAYRVMVPEFNNEHSLVCIFVEIFLVAIHCHHVLLFMNKIKVL